MRPGVWSLTVLYPRNTNSEAPRRPMVDEPLEPLVPGAWAAWARRYDAEQARDQAAAAAPRSLRRPAFHTTRS